MTRLTGALVKRVLALIEIVLFAGLPALPGGMAGAAKGAEPSPTSIKRVDTPLFNTLDYQGGVFEFNGGLLNFWMEVEADGKTTPLFVKEIDNFKIQAANLAKATKGKLSAGHLAWVVRFQDGKEVWDFAVTVSEAEGKGKASLRLIGVSPPQASASKARLTEVGGPSGALKVDKETTLFTIETTDEKGKAIRTARLKVDPAK